MENRVELPVATELINLTGRPKTFTNHAKLECLRFEGGDFKG